jgi:hypothetical protein
MDDPDQPIEITKTEARQGIQLHAVRKILFFGTIGAILALLVTVFLVT